MLILAQMLVLEEKLLWHILAFIGMVSPLYCLPIATCYKICYATVCRNLHWSINTEDSWDQKVCKEASATFLPSVGNQGSSAVLNSLIVIVTPLDRQSRCALVM